MLSNIRELCTRRWDYEWYRAQEKVFNWWVSINPGQYCVPLSQSHVLKLVEWGQGSIHIFYLDDATCPGFFYFSGEEWGSQRLAKKKKK